MMDPRTIALEDYFSKVEDRQVQSVTFVERYVQLHLVDAIITCMAEPSIETSMGVYHIPSKNGNWEFCSLIKEDINSVIEGDQQIEISVGCGKLIRVNLRINPPGANFQIRGWQPTGTAFLNRSQGKSFW